MRSLVGLGRSISMGMLVILPLFFNYQWLKFDEEQSIDSEKYSSSILGCYKSYRCNTTVSTTATTECTWTIYFKWCIKGEYHSTWCNYQSFPLFFCSVDGRVSYTRDLFIFFYLDTLFSMASSCGRYQSSFCYNLNRIWSSQHSSSKWWFIMPQSFLLSI